MIKGRRGRYRAILAAALCVVSVPAAFAADLSATYKEAETACSFYVAAVSSGNEDLYPHEFVVWRDNCQHHPDKLRCQDANDTLHKLQPEARWVLKCEPHGK